MHIFDQQWRNCDVGAKDVLAETEQCVKGYDGMGGERLASSQLPVGFHSRLHCSTGDEMQGLALESAGVLDPSWRRH